MERNVIVAVFNVESEGYQALSELKQTADTAAYRISAAALVKSEDGKFTVIDGFDSGADTLNDTAVGGLVGMAVGVLGGPVGMLLGASYGSLIGMTMDVSDASFGVSMLEQVAGKLDDGMLALIALADEEAPDALDEKLSAFDAVIARFDAAVVEEEVLRAEEMQKEMARLARQELRQQKIKDTKDKVRKGLAGKLGEMKDKLEE